MSSVGHALILTSIALVLGLLVTVFSGLARDAEKVSLEAAA
jgi:hypothetical protein